jgi:hypothetical protein
MRLRRWPRAGVVNRAGGGLEGSASCGHAVQKVGEPEHGGEVEGDVNQRPGALVACETSFSPEAWIVAGEALRELGCFR